MTFGEHRTVVRRQDRTATTHAHPLVTPLPPAKPFGNSVPSGPAGGIHSAVLYLLSSLNHRHLERDSMQWRRTAFLAGLLLASGSAMLIAGPAPATSPAPTTSPSPTEHPLDAIFRFAGERARVGELNALLHGSLLCKVLGFPTNAAPRLDECFLKPFDRRASSDNVEANLRCAIPPKDVPEVLAYLKTPIVRKLAELHERTAENYNTYRSVKESFKRTLAAQPPSSRRVSLAKRLISARNEPSIATVMRDIRTVIFLKANESRPPSEQVSSQDLSATIESGLVEVESNWQLHNHEDELFRWRELTDEECDLYVQMSLAPPIISFLRAQINAETKELHQLLLAGAERYVAQAGK